LDSGKRKPIGVRYTCSADIRLLIQPVLPRLLNIGSFSVKCDGAAAEEIERSAVRPAGARCEAAKCFDDRSILKTLENADAILRNKVGKPFEATWADADYIIGNPPFLGEKNLRRELGDKYVEDLFVCSKSADRS
jgi:hypothetical protein